MERRSNRCQHGELTLIADGGKHSYDLKDCSEYDFKLLFKAILKLHTTN